MRDIAERMRVPRALYTAFPVGRSLGKPRDRTFQHNVLKAAFCLLEAPKGPILIEFPERISSDCTEPLLCALPPRMDISVHPAVDEAQALKAAYDRARRKTKRTSVGMQIVADEVPEALKKFLRIVEGTDWNMVGFSAASIYGTAHDIRSYYEEISCELAEGAIGSWATEEWFYDSTEAGQLILRARRTMREKNVAQSIWFGLAPAGRA
ncbi:MAG: hypothetical protein CBC09_05435 [Cellvibrionales bacterium TMED49]|nr:hypothetical protein [Porticoccaceae bacterium]OUU38435.1 MAG: hypothetical protein CBC09_05435 [Cellvibrionales bacterium TMED49]|tara:strand:- start:357 stop:983 length:627 start_codon:yes stop_codon:yes gene_type:complete